MSLTCHLSTEAEAKCVLRASTIDTVQSIEYLTRSIPRQDTFMPRGTCPYYSYFRSPRVHRGMRAWIVSIPDFNIPVGSWWESYLYSYSTITSDTHKHRHSDQLHIKITSTGLPAKPHPFDQVLSIQTAPSSDRGLPGIHISSGYQSPLTALSFYTFNILLSIWNIDVESQKRWE